MWPLRCIKTPHVTKHRLGRCHAMSKCRLLNVAWKQTNAMWCYNSRATFFDINSANIVRPSKANHRMIGNACDQLATTLSANFSLIRNCLLVTRVGKISSQSSMDPSSNERRSDWCILCKFILNPEIYVLLRGDEMETSTAAVQPGMRSVSVDVSLSCTWPDLRLKLSEWLCARNFLYEVSFWVLTISFTRCERLLIEWRAAVLPSYYLKDSNKLIRRGQVWHFLWQGFPIDCIPFLLFLSLQEVPIFQASWWCGW